MFFSDRSFGFDGVIAIDREKYIAELTNLLSFMSSWDRKLEIRRYERLFDAAEDVEALIEQLGTPTKVAVELAKDYVSSPPPDMSRWDNVPPPLPDGPEESATPELPLEIDEEYTVSPIRSKRRLRLGGTIVFVLLLLVFGIPIAAVLICIGLPFLVAGSSCAGSAADVIFQNITVFRLFSDVLLVLGAGLVLVAAGVLLAWFGLWVSVSLCRLWIAKALLPLGRALCYGKEE